MKFRNQARLCLAIYDFDARIMLSLCSFKVPDYQYEKKFS